MARGPWSGCNPPGSASGRRAKLDDVRVHDLRHGFASVAVAAGESLYLTGKLLGHARPETSARYAHVGDDPLKAAADRVSARVAAALAGSGRGAEAVSMTGRR